MSKDVASCVASYAKKIGVKFPVNFTDGALLFHHLLESKISSSIFTRLVKRYNLFIDDIKPFGVYKIEKTLSFDQMVSLYKVVITFLRPDFRYNNEADIHMMMSRTGFAKNTIRQYRSYAKEYDILFGIRDSDHINFCDYDEVLLTEIRNNGQACLSAYEKWPVTKFIKNLSHVQKSFLPLSCSGKISYVKVPENDDTESYRLDFVGVSTSQIMFMSSNDYDPKGQKIDQIWIARVSVQEDSEGKDYAGDYYALFANDWHRGELLLKAANIGKDLVFSGKFRDSKKERWGKIFYRINSEFTDRIDVPSLPSKQKKSKTKSKA
jgi:hypothetical protein